jgi:hypothetical protein
VVEDGGIAELHFTATDDVGAEHQYVIVLQHDDAETQFAGQRELAKLVNAAGLEQIEDSAELMGRSIVMTGESFTAPTTRPDDEPPLPVKPEPVRYADTVSEHSIEPPADYGTKAWERRYTARQVGNAARKQWDKAHPQMFEDTLPPPPDDWPEWLDAEFEQDDAA